VISGSLIESIRVKDVVQGLMLVDMIDDVVKNFLKYVIGHWLF